MLLSAHRRREAPVSIPSSRACVVSISNAFAFTSTNVCAQAETSRLSPSGTRVAGHFLPSRVVPSNPYRASGCRGVELSRDEHGGSSILFPRCRSSIVAGLGFAVWCSSCDAAPNTYRGSTRAFERAVASRSRDVPEALSYPRSVRFRSSISRESLAVPLSYWGWGSWVPRLAAWCAPCRPRISIDSTLTTSSPALLHDLSSPPRRTVGGRIEDVSLRDSWRCGRPA